MISWPTFKWQEDLLALDGYWGYCSPSCSGELPSPTSEYSLTTRPNLWSLALFDLSTWGSGICYTYDPPAEVGVVNQKIDCHIFLQGWTRSIWAAVCIVGTSVSSFFSLSSFASSIEKTFTRDKVVFVDEFLGFNIYLHDKGQFWPGLEMGEFISFKKLGNWWCKMADPMCF